MALIAKKINIYIGEIHFLSFFVENNMEKKNKIKEKIKSKRDNRPRQEFRREEERRKKKNGF